MKKNYFLSVTLLSVFMFFGFSNSDNPEKMTFDYSGPPLERESSPYVTDNNNPNSSAAIYYTDNFDLPSDTNGLKARGYLVYYRGSGPQAGGATWFQGNPAVFSAFNGATNSYVGANFQVVSGVNNIDSWLVLPDVGVVAGDILSFRCRSVLNGTFPDSVRVMYNDLGGLTPEAAGWVELGRFKASTDGTWELKTFVLPTGSFSGSIAIRYNVVNGGPAGDNSDYIGIDAIELDGDGLLPVELSSFVSTISNNNVTLNWSTASETNNSGFDIERNSNGQWSKIGNVTGNGTTPISNNYSFTDRNLTSGIYNYRLKQIDFNGNFEYFNLNSEVNIGVPAKFELSQNYPNPFNPSTQINYNLPVDGKVSLRLFDMSGKEISTIVNEVKTAGYYSVSFNAGNLPSGVYFYSIEANDFSAVKKMMLVK